mmetsp:Transcript_12565/g.25589  ORF Transcript_12565/g.25589 Transcript_12565/m.25589 type:complete len:205 (-) Transcript_12565:339-953(-)
MCSLTELWLNLVFFHSRLPSVVSLQCCLLRSWSSTLLLLDSCQRLAVLRVGWPLPLLPDRIWIPRPHDWPSDRTTASEGQRLSPSCLVCSRTSCLPSSEPTWLPRPRRSTSLLRSGWNLSSKVELRPNHRNDPWQQQRWLAKPRSLLLLILLLHHRRHLRRHPGLRLNRPSLLKPPRKIPPAAQKSTPLPLRSRRLLGDVSATV